MIVILSPGFDPLPGVFDRSELVHVQALITQPTVEGFDERVLRRFARANEIKLYPTVPCPFVQELSYLLNHLALPAEAGLLFGAADASHGSSGDLVPAGESSATCSIARAFRK